MKQWAIATAEEHGVVIGQKRFAKPRNGIVIVDEIYYNDWNYPDFDMQRVSVCFDYSLVDPVGLATVLRDSEVITEDVSK